MLVPPRSTGETRRQSQRSVEVWAVTNSPQKPFFLLERNHRGGQRSEEGDPVQ